MAMNCLIKNGLLVDPVADRYGEYDLMIKEGKIVGVGKDLAGEGLEVIDARNLVIMPGLIDLHVHLREPGQEEKETIATGTRAAAKGGFTSITAMPNTIPSADSASVITFVKAKSKEEGVVRVYPVGNITKGGVGRELAELADLTEAGAVAFSDDGLSILNAEVERYAFMYGKLFNKPFLLHCEDKNLTADGVMHEGTVSTRLGLKGIPAVAEEVIIARDLLLAEETGARIHLCHISTKRSLDLFRGAKARGVKVTAEVTPHHLTLTDQEVAGYNTATKVSPPLRPLQDVEALQEALIEGAIDLIATDHAPHTKEEKHQEYSLAPFGMTGLETALGVILTKFYHTGKISLERIVQLMSVNPAKVLNIPGGTLKEGSPADLILLDLNTEWEVKKDDFISKGKNSPFIGKKLKGKNLATMVAGEWVYKS
jgi:dihydroorotase